MLLDLRSLEEAQAASSSNTGNCATGQGGQSSDCVGKVGQRVQVQDGGLAPRILSVPIRWGRTIRPRDIAGTVETGQGGQSSSGTGSVRNIPAVSGVAETGQAAAAEVIAIGAVDNTRPKNIRKSKQLIALLLAA